MSDIKMKEIPLWKWIVELFVGIILFLLLYGLSNSVLDIRPVSAGIIMLFLASAGMLALFMLWTRLIEKSWRSELLLKNVPKNLFSGLAIGFLFFCAVSAVLWLTGCSGIEYASPSWTYILVNLGMYLLVACSEEVVFRGIMFRMIDERFGMWQALGISALVFGFMHIPNPNATVWSSAAIAVEAGVLLGAVYKYSGSLWLPIGLHWAWNFTQGNVFGLPVSGGGGSETIFRTTVSGPEIITGGDFGPEASIIAFVLGALLSALFIRLYLRSRRVASAASGTRHYDLEELKKV